MKHWTEQAAGRVLLTGATGLSAAGCCGNSRSRTAGVLRNTGWYYGNGFWRLRGLLEEPSAARRGRRDPVRLAAGDTLDFGGSRPSKRIGSCRLSSEMQTQATNDLPHRGEPERGQDDETGDVEIGPAQLAVEDVAVSRVRLL